MSCFLRAASCELIYLGLTVHGSPGAWGRAAFRPSILWRTCEMVKKRLRLVKTESMKITSKYEGLAGEDARPLGVPSFLNAKVATGAALCCALTLFATGPPYLFVQPHPYALPRPSLLRCLVTIALAVACACLVYRQTDAF